MRIRTTITLYSEFELPDDAAAMAEWFDGAATPAECITRQAAWFKDDPESAIEQSGDLKSITLDLVDLDGVVITSVKVDTGC